MFNTLVRRLILAIMAAAIALVVSGLPVRSAHAAPTNAANDTWRVNLRLEIDLACDGRPDHGIRRDVEPHLVLLYEPGKPYVPYAVVRLADKPVQVQVPSPNVEVRILDPTWQAGYQICGYRPPVRFLDQTDFDRPTGSRPGYGRNTTMIWKIGTQP